MFDLEYNPSDWYWRVGEKLYSSKANAYIEGEHADFTAFLNDGGIPTDISSEDDLIEVMLSCGIIPPFCTKERQRAWAIKQLSPAMRILFENQP